MQTVEKIAQVIRIADGNNTMGAGLLAEHIAAALPDMVVPLVWEGVESDCYTTCEALGFSYELCVCDTLDRPCDYVWEATVKPDNMARWRNSTKLATPAQASFEQAKAAAQKDYTRRIMSALGITDKGEG